MVNLHNSEQLLRLNEKYEITNHWRFLKSSVSVDEDKALTLEDPTAKLNEASTPVPVAV
jgi:hypothetical protein